MKIAYIINGLYNPAGMERVLTIRANYLCEFYDITFITYAQGERPDYFPLDKRIKRVDIDDKKSYFTGVKDFLLKSHYDITVSTGGAEFYFLYKIKDGSKKVFEFHFSYDISKVWMRNISNPFKRKIWTEIQKFRRIYIANRYDHVVVLTKTDCIKWKKWISKVSYIYNPSTVACDHISTSENKSVIAVGRLSYEKGFDYLIDVWKIIYHRFPDWTLDIYGEGALKIELQNRINEIGLSAVIKLRGVTNDIVTEYQNHSIYVMTSRNEGFPLVLIEGGSCGLPIVSFNCPNGPNEIVKHGHNGFLVSPVGNVKAMANYLMQLMSDRTLRKKMGCSSFELSKRFKLENIASEWISLYNQLLCP